MKKEPCQTSRNEKQSHSFIHSPNIYLADIMCKHTLGSGHIAVNKLDKNLGPTRGYILIKKIDNEYNI